MAREQLELRAASGNEKPVFGISEWMCYYANYDKPCPGPEALDECVDLHLQAGCDHLVWNLGRSVVDYWSELPLSTRMCENGDQVGGISWSFVRKVMDEVCPLRHALVRMAYLAQLLSDVGVPAIVAEQANALPRPTRPRPEIGMDWHAHIEGRHSLRTEAGDAAL